MGRAHAHRRGPDRARAESRQSRRRAHPTIGADARHFVGGHRPPRRGWRIKPDKKPKPPRRRARRCACPPPPVPWCHRRTVEFVWLTDGVDLGRGASFVDGLGRQLKDQRPVTLARRRRHKAHALPDADNAAGALSVKVLRAQTGDDRENGTVRALDLKGLPLGDAPFSFKDGERETEAEVQSAGGNPQRHRAAGNRRRAPGGRGAASRQALAPPYHRHNHRLDQRHRATAAGLDLLSGARARPVRRRAARRPRLAGASRSTDSSTSACRC